MSGAPLRSKEPLKIMFMVSRNPSDMLIQNRDTKAFVMKNQPISRDVTKPAGVGEQFVEAQPNTSAVTALQGRAADNSSEFPSRHQDAPASDEICSLRAIDMARLIRQRKLSSRELMEAH